MLIGRRVEYGVRPIGFHNQIHFFTVIYVTNHEFELLFRMALDQLIAQIKQDLDLLLAARKRGKGAA